MGARTRMGLRLRISILISRIMRGGGGSGEVGLRDTIGVGVDYERCRCFSEGGELMVFLVEEFDVCAEDGDQEVFGA